MAATKIGFGDDSLFEEFQLHSSQKNRVNAEEEKIICTEKHPGHETDYGSCADSLSLSKIDGMKPGEGPYMVDTSGLVSCDGDTYSSHGTAKQPLYDSNTDTFLLGVTEDKDAERREKEEKELQPKVRGGVTCYNCFGKHRLVDCPEPRDQRRIRENRTKIQFASNMRYTDSVGLAGSSSSHIKPGIISPSLRHALGIRDHQLPEYVYRMRVMGYPPGHLLEAMFERNALAIFNTDQEAHDGNARTMDDKEVESGHSFLDLSKIIEYPGFNMPLPNRTYDEYEYYRCPPLQRDQLKVHLEKLPNAVPSDDILPSNGVVKDDDRPDSRSKDRPASSSPDVEEGEVVEDNHQQRHSRREHHRDRGGRRGDDDGDRRLGRHERRGRDSHRHRDEQDGAARNRRSRSRSRSRDRDREDGDVVCIDDYVVVDSTDLDKEDLVGERQRLVARLNSFQAMQEPPTDGDPTGGTAPPTHPATLPATPTILRSFSSVSQGSGTPLVSHPDDDTTATPSALQFSEGISEHVPHENLPGYTGIFDKLRTGVLRKIQQWKSSTT